MAAELLWYIQLWLRDWESPEGHTCNWVYLCWTPINPADNPNPVYSHLTRDNIISQETYKFWGSHSGDYEEFYLLRYTAVLTCWLALLASCYALVSCLAYSSTLKMEATCSSETSVEFQRTIRRYTPEDRTIQEITSITYTKTALFWGNL
jgi:hypothetical protein